MSDNPSPRHPSNLATPFYSILDGGRRDNSAAGSLSGGMLRTGEFRMRLHQDFTLANIAPVALQSYRDGFWVEANSAFC
jgi:hypothetical protein